MKELVKGQIADLPVGYEVKIEDGTLKVSATADIAGILDVAEKKLPAGQLQPFEVALIEMAKSAVKAL